MRFTEDSLQLSPHVNEVLFSPGDEFVGVDAQWLLPRLRLDPKLSPLELMDSQLTIEINDDHIEDLDQRMSIFGGDSQYADLASFSNGPAGIIGGDFALKGNWVHFLAYEITNRYTWIGPIPHRRDLVRRLLSTDAFYWEPTTGEEYRVESAYLDPRNPEDKEFLLSLGAKAESVVLNETRLR